MLRGDACMFTWYGTSKISKGRKGTHSLCGPHSFSGKGDVLPVMQKASATVAVLAAAPPTGWYTPMTWQSSGGQRKLATALYTHASESAGLSGGAQQLGAAQHTLCSGYVCILAGHL